MLSGNKFYATLLAIASPLLAQQVTLRWEKVPEAHQYQIEIFQKDVSILSKKVSGETPFWTGELKVGVFRYEIRAFDRFEQPSEFRYSDSIVIPPDAPSALPTSPNKKTMKLQWKAVAGAELYEVEVFSENKTVSETSTTELSLDTGVLPPGDYRWHVRAALDLPKNMGARSPFSELQRFSVPKPEPVRIPLEIGSRSFVKLEAGAMPYQLVGSANGGELVASSIGGHVGIEGKYALNSYASALGHIQSSIVNLEGVLRQRLIGELAFAYRKALTANFTLISQGGVGFREFFVATGTATTLDFSTPRALGPLCDLTLAYETALGQVYSLGVSGFVPLSTAVFSYGYGFKLAAQYPLGETWGIEASVNYRGEFLELITDVRSRFSGMYLGFGVVWWPNELRREDPSIR